MMQTIYLYFCIQNPLRGHQMKMQWQDMLCEKNSCEMHTKGFHIAHDRRKRLPSTTSIIFRIATKKIPEIGLLDTIPRNLCFSQRWFTLSRGLRTWLPLSLFRESKILDFYTDCLFRPSVKISNDIKCKKGKTLLWNCRANSGIVQECSISKWPQIIFSLSSESHWTNQQQTK